MFLLPHDTQLHIFHQQFCFFHLFAHSSCITTKTFQLFLKASKETSLTVSGLTRSTFFSLMLNLLLSSIFSPFATSFLFCHLCIFTKLNPRRLLAHFLQWSLSVQRTSCSMNASQWSDILRLFSQHLSLSHLFIFVVLPCLCPPSLGTGRLPLNVMHMEISLPPGRKKMSSMLQMLHHFKMKPCLQ